MSTDASTELRIPLDPYGTFLQTPAQTSSSSVDQSAELAKCRQSLGEAHDAFLLSKDSKDYQEIVDLTEKIQSLWLISHPLNESVASEITNLEAVVRSAQKDALDKKKVKTIESPFSKIVLINNYAIFKQNPTAFFEEFCFRASIVTGDEIYFVPTKYLSDLSFHPNIQYHFSKVDEKIAGSIQPYLPHSTLRSVLEREEERIYGKKRELTLVDINERTMINNFHCISTTARIILACGMRDCHAGNILVSSTRWFLFDNGESWSQSADLITDKYSQHLPSCRCCLLHLAPMYTSLDEEGNRDAIRRDLNQYPISDENAELSDFLMCQDYKFNLPSEVFNHKDTLEAWRERVKRMLKAIDDPKVVNLRDFFFAVQPIIKFLALWNIAYALRMGEDNIAELTDPIQIQMQALKKSILLRNCSEFFEKDGVGGASLEEELGNLKVIRICINPRIIWEMTNSDRPFDDLVIEIQNLIKSRPTDHEYMINRWTENKVERDKLLSELIVMAKPDYKSL